MKFLAVLGVLLACSSHSEAQTYMPIDYNGTHPVGEVYRCEAGNNPLGYYCTTQYNFENTGNSPTRYSFSSADVDGRKMEIIVEPFDQASTVAFKVAGATIRGNGAAQYCEDAVAGDVIFECDDGDGCPNSDITIWYRITLSPNEPDPENWCNERGDLANLPSSLLVAPRETDNNVDQDLSRPDNNVSVYEPIDYNGTHPVGEVNRCEAGNNPLGYYCTTQYNENKGNSTRYSFSSEDVNGRKMEIIVEPFDQTSTVAFKVAGAIIRGNGAAQYCEDAVAGDVIFECDDGDGCPNSDITIWYRITLSPNEPDPENWCNERGDLANLPSSLLVAPRETDNNVDQDLSRPDNNVSVYEPIDYNGTHPVGEVNRCEAGNNPLGYYCTTQYNENKGNSTRYSFSSEDVNGRKMEIIVEPFDQTSTVAFKVAGAIIRGNGAIQFCGDAIAGDVIFECNVGDGCPNSDISIWYRITLSPNETDPGNWCNERGDLANRPSSLIVAPRETDNNVNQDLSCPGHGLPTTSTFWLVSLLVILTRLLLV